VALRVDASVELGSGHLIRCTALALALRRVGIDSTFVCAQLPGSLEQELARGGFEVARLTGVRAAVGSATPFAIDEHADSAATQRALQARGTYECVISDHYGVGHVWQSGVRPLAPLLVAIDDLADRRLEADVVLNQNPGSDYRYRGLVPKGCRQLLGPRFALLRPEFAAARARLSRGTQVRDRVVLFAGGGDPGNATGAVLDAWELASLVDQPLDVVIGAQNTRAVELRARCDRMQGVTLHVQTDRMADLLVGSRLLIGAAGSVSWERCCLGVASLMFSIADNQKQNLSFLTARRTGIDLGEAPGLAPRTLSGLLRKIVARPRLLERMGRRAAQLVDGAGAIRAAIMLAASAVRLREAKGEDADLVWPWRNSPSTRRFFRDSRPLVLADHLEWWQRTLADRTRHLLVAHCGQQDVGVLRFDVHGASAEIAIYVDPSLTGLGLGRAILRAGQEWARSAGAALARLEAEVAPDNTASNAAFAAAGFVKRDTRWCWEVER
jgi:UDP-2,4-diacetamido-2,4,6-trideoxy-beta-L-altropyranose hydrolase